VAIGEALVLFSKEESKREGENDAEEAPRVIGKGDIAIGAWRREWGRMF
jgi:hypothetical protein